jgi:hypothetical protein
VSQSWRRIISDHACLDVNQPGRHRPSLYDPKSCHELSFQGMIIQWSLSLFCSGQDTQFMESPSRKTSLVTMKCAGPHCSLCDGSPLLDLNTRSLDNASMLNCFKRQIPPPKHCVVGLLKEHMLSTLFTFMPTTRFHLLLPESYFRKLFVILVVPSTNLQSSTNRHHLNSFNLSLCLCSDLQSRSALEIYASKTR